MKDYKIPRWLKRLPVPKFLQDREFGESTRWEYLLGEKVSNEGGMLNSRARRLSRKEIKRGR